jgi:hypothetical protein
MNQMNEFGRTLNVRKVEATLIKEIGDYVLSVVRREYVTSFEKNLSHEMKEDITTLQENGELWIDATPQLAITFGSVNGDGVITHRFNAKGYLRQDDAEVTDELLEKEDVLVIKGYVCQESKEHKGMYERIESPEKTEKALNILFGFMNKLGFTNEEEDVETCLQRAIDEKYPIVGTVDTEEYEGKERLVISKFSKATLEDVTPEEDEVTDEDFKG